MPRNIKDKKKKKTVLATSSVVTGWLRKMWDYCWMGAEDDLMAVDRGKDEITERAQSVCITLLWQGISGVSA